MEALSLMGTQKKQSSKHNTQKRRRRLLKGYDEIIGSFIGCTPEGYLRHSAGSAMHEVTYVRAAQAPETSTWYQK